MKKEIERLMDINYEKFIKALLSIENSQITEEEIDSLYKIYMKDDSFYLINERFYTKV